MKNLIMISFLCIFSSTCCMEKPITQIPPITVVINSNPQQTVSTQQETQVITTQVQSTPTAFEQVKNAGSFLKTHKYKCILSAIVLNYVTVMSKLWYDQQYLAHKDRWSYWKSHLSLSEMQLHTQQELEKELLLEIQRRYINPHNPTDFVMPLVRFVQEITYEINTIDRMLKMYEWISRLYMSKIFLSNAQLIQKLHEQKQRLQFIHHVFTSWAAQYNMNNI